MYRKPYYALSSKQIGRRLNKALGSNFVNINSDQLDIPSTIIVGEVNSGLEDYDEEIPSLNDMHFHVHHMMNRYHHKKKEMGNSPKVLAI